MVAEVELGGDMVISSRMCRVLQLNITELSKEDLVRRYVCTIKASGLMCYLLETEYDEPNDVANKPWVPVRREEMAQFAEANNKRRVFATCLLL